MAEEEVKTTEEVKEEKVEIPAKFADLVKQIETLSVLDLSELVKVLEGHFGVSAAAPAAAAAPVPAGEAEAAEEKSAYTVTLTAAGDSKINVIKAVREITGLGLAESKGLVDGAPKPVKENVPKAEADEAKKKLEEAGATVELS
jgi:large subunit ribosomal protein L7/L12